MIFYKSVASGNDFLQIDTREIQSYINTDVAKAGVKPGKGPLAERLCHRHTGAGADGVVFYTLNEKENITPPMPATVNFEIYNRDGSEAELSGNGMAGLAALMFHLDLFTTSVTLNTRIGQRTHRLLYRNGNLFRINIEIGAPDFLAHHLFPFLDKDKIKKNEINYQWEGHTFYPVSLGNPHAVLIIDKPMEDQELEELGERFEGATIFPHKTNVEFVLPALPGPVLYETSSNLRIFFYERGVGKTLASSTGSAAVFAVLQKLGKVTDTLLIDNIKSPNTTPPPEKNQGKKIKISGKEKIFIENSVEIVYKGIVIT